MCLILNVNATLAQQVQQEKMAELDFMIGAWVGLSTSIDNGRVVSSVPAFQNISYKVDKHIISIDLQSENLQLHTVIYYSEEDKTYFYNPYYKSGTAKYRATCLNGKLIVNASKTKRFIFKLTPDGNLQEYGENFENGKWVKYFEDNFKKF
ncbi:MAG: hypothetical protein ABR595_03175 [Psychroflexus sp.]